MGKKNEIVKETEQQHNCAHKLTFTCGSAEAVVTCAELVEAGEAVCSACRRSSANCRRSRAASGDVAWVDDMGFVDAAWGDEAGCACGT